MSSELKIIKSGGHCYDGTGWNLCPFWEHNTDNPNNCYCKLFGGLKGVQKYTSESLVICNKIYGINYEGDI